ncbi:MAG: ABC transporter permease, partial [Acidobacteriota bacterium]|nr:ABC transporter permease [Acidobacteriota bacterium]
IYCELTIVTAIAVLFSSFSSPALSSLLTFLVFVIGHFSASLKEFAVNLGSDAAVFVFSLIYYVLPNLSHFSFATPAAHGKVPDLATLSGTISYALVYSAVLLFATILIFRRRNLK